MIFENRSVQGVHEDHRILPNATIGQKMIFRDSRRMPFYQALFLAKSSLNALDQDITLTLQIQLTFLLWQNELHGDFYL
jgi:hypothetical protein